MISRTSTLFLAMLVLVTISQANGSLVRSYLFESDSQAGANNSGATTPEANGGPAMTLLGPEGTVADAGSAVAYNGRLKNAEGVLHAVPYGGASDFTYDGYVGNSLGATMWFKTNGPIFTDTNDWSGLLGIGNVNGSPDFELSLAKTTTGGATNGSYIQSFSYTGGNSWVNADPTKQGVAGQVPLDDSTWHHVGLSVSDAGTDIFIDGQLAAHGPAPGRAPQGNNGLHIAKNVAFGSYFDGWVDNLHVYNHAITLSEVQGVWMAESTAAIPEPATLALLGLCSLLTLFTRKRQS
jgi:hypothetical protein